MTEASAVVGTRLGAGAKVVLSMPGKDNLVLSAAIPAMQVEETRFVRAGPRSCQVWREFFVGQRRRGATKDQ